MSSQVKILSYNILDVELESNFVPRNMHTSCKEAIFAAAGITEKDKKTEYWNDNFAELYGPFHSGYDGKSKSETRKLWGDFNATPEKTAPNKNLIQKLRELFPDDTAVELYNTIARINYPWVENRLQRVFDKIISYDPDVICLQEYGNCKDLPQVQSGGTTFPSNASSDSREIKQDTLADKLTQQGYTYQLYSYNPDERNGDDGLAIFFKGNVFNSDTTKIYIDMDDYNQQKYSEKYKTQRGCGLLELTFRNTATNSPSSGNKLIVCTTHIQTTSNEKVKDDKYAIRRGELDYIKNYINTNYKNNEMVVFCGDFNLDLNTPADKVVIDAFETGNIVKRIKYNKDAEADDLGLVTSYPTGRKEYIDYFFTNCGGTLEGDYKFKSELNDETIPNSTDQPSDHIPILLTITLPVTMGGRTRKRRNSKKTRKMKKNKSKKTKKSNKSKRRQKH